MLAKLIVSAPERAAAIERLAWALDRFAVLGVATNIPLLRAIAVDDDYRAGHTTTAYLDTHDFAEAIETPQPAPLVLAAAALWEAASTGEDAPRGMAFNPWTSRAALGAGAVRRFRYTTGDQEHVVILTPDAAGHGYVVSLDGAEYDGGRTLAIRTQPDGATTLYAGDLRATLHFARRELGVLAFWRGTTYALHKPGALTVEAAAHAGEVTADRQLLTAPMAGTVLAVNVAEGDAVEPHQPLAVLGAMKMEHAITSPFPARVVRVHHQAGDVVPGGELLLELEIGASGGEPEPMPMHRA